MKPENETNEEHFQSIIDKMKNKTKSKNNKRNGNRGSNRNKLGESINKKKKSNGVTFDDIISQTENMDIEKYTISSLKESFWDYVGSFNSEKFNNITGTNNEALEKIYMFKDKFFEIFE
jgi:hypothetical protein